MTTLSAEACKAQSNAKQRSILSGVIPPEPTTRKTLLDLVAETIASKQQWHIGEDVVIWKSGKAQAYIVNEDSRLKLCILREGKKLSENVITEALTVGYNQGGVWTMRDRQALEHYTVYPDWQRKVQKKLGIQ